jgi:transcription elongation factor GreB
LPDRYPLTTLLGMKDELPADMEPDDEDDDIVPAAESPAPVKNLMTPHGHAALRDELRFLLRTERPRIVEIVSWAAGNGDRS